MDTEKKKRVPGTPNEALVKAASLAKGDWFIFWRFGGRVKAVVAELGEIEIVAGDNTLLIAALLDRIEELENQSR